LAARPAWPVWCWQRCGRVGSANTTRGLRNG